MEKRVRDELNILKNIIIRTIPVEKIFLFGERQIEKDGILLYG